MKRIIIVLALALLATKPCPPHPCPTTAVCDEKADWVAVGHIEHLEHNVQGMPFNHDFAKFTFVVEKWVKGGDKLPREIPFAVGWCENNEQMRDGKGKFKFWGMNGGPPWRFLHFEHVVTPSVSEGPGGTGGAPHSRPGPSLTLGVTIR